MIRRKAERGLFIALLGATAIFVILSVVVLARGVSALL